MGELIPVLATVLKESPRGIRAACVQALAAVVLTDVTPDEYSPNLDTLQRERIVQALLAVLQEPASPATEAAVHLLAELTKSRSIARECTSTEAIDTIHAVLRKATGTVYEKHAMQVVANLAKLSDKRGVVGSRGVVYDLVEVLQSGAGDNRVLLAFEIVGDLVGNETNASQFKDAGGVRAVERLLSDEQHHTKYLKSLASMVDSSTQLRSEMASNAIILKVCVASLTADSEEERLCAAQVCRVLVKESPAVIQAIDKAGGIETLARANNVFANQAMVNAIRTQQQVLVTAGLLQPSRAGAAA